MTEFISGSALASYLEVADSAALDNIAERTNKLIDETWSNPVDPVPAWVTNIAYAVAVRAGSNPRGLTSQTKSWDDITKTERWEAGSHEGVGLTDAEASMLQGASDTTSPVRSIRMRIPSWDNPCRY